MNQGHTIANVKLVTQGMDSHAWIGMNAYMVIIIVINMLSAITMTEDIHVFADRVTMEMENIALVRMISNDLSILFLFFCFFHCTCSKMYLQSLCLMK